MNTTPRFCGQCGSPLKPGLRFCEVCGTALAPAAPLADGGAVEAVVAAPDMAALPTVAHSSRQRTGAPASLAGTAPVVEASASPALAPHGSPALEWDYAIPVATNRFILRDMVVVFGLSMLILQAILALMGLILEGEALLLPPSFWALIAAILVVLFGLASLVLLNRVQAHFRLDVERAQIMMGGRERKMNRLATWLGLMTGKPGLAGAGLLAQAQETQAIAWQDVYAVKVHPKQRVISLHNSWRTVIRLYCSPEVFDAAVAWVRSYTTPH